MAPRIPDLPRNYADIYPSEPLLNSEEFGRVSASALMSVRYFQAEPDTMPEEVFTEHHVLLNLCDTPHRVQNRRDGDLRDSRSTSMKSSSHRPECALAGGGLASPT